MGSRVNTIDLPHAENAVEFSRDEGHARFVGSLGEGLTFDLERADGDGVGGEKAGETAGSVTNGELRAILDVGGRGSAVVFVVQKAGNVKQRTLLGGHPQVGRSWGKRTWRIHRHSRIKKR